MNNKCPFIFLQLLSASHTRSCLKYSFMFRRNIYCLIKFLVNVSISSFKVLLYTLLHRLLKVFLLHWIRVYQANASSERHS